MAGMGEKRVDVKINEPGPRIYATAVCAGGNGCSGGLLATGWHQEFHDVTGLEDAAGGRPAVVPGLVEFTGWHHATSTSEREHEPLGAIGMPAEIKPTELGRKILTDAGQLPPAPTEVVHRYPHVVKWSDIEAFLQAIGVDPIDRNTLSLIEIAPAGIRFERIRKRPVPSGRLSAYLTGQTSDSDAAKQITTARIEWPR